MYFSRVFFHFNVPQSLVCTLLRLKKLHIVVYHCPLRQHKFCIDREYILYANLSHHRPHKREKTHKLISLYKQYHFAADDSFP